MEPKVYSVTQLNKYLKMVFEKNTVLFNISIRGEITNFKPHYTGHLYFTLKDESSCVKCVMFKSYASSLKFNLADGMKVVVTGQVAVYEANGTYQIYCHDIAKEGLGELYQKYEQLKAKLEKEGLFDESHKKRIPFLPKRVGVITSKTGAVIRDIINVSTRRFNRVNLLIYPAATQGVNVKDTVVQGIKELNRLNNVDVIIIARGGGSFEDLFGFNDEEIARQIYDSNIPIVSAVGHETDFTICDFVSDLRAPTPSAAAELVYPNMSEIISRIDILKLRCIKAVQNNLNLKYEKLNQIKKSRLEKIPLDKIMSSRMKIDLDIKKIESILSLKVQKEKSRYLSTISKLDAMSPLKTLSRGYIIAQSEEGTVITKKEDISVGEELKITVVDGNIKAKVTEVN